ncbi:formylglycine-generating enzyme family protein [Chamaesiphon sp. OTE_75_metabat_556]|uniref:formylglycine-generating enzyme family protein n=1 Tax=Chamaesiphon sp. OTE_75_metabat_556 TaxID=2964692 RepID=UPI002869FFCD|nr:formylglycine-generating enzyme family protein [Chamaesiphon sp. OTE_75_metabat_556]
MAQLPIAKHSQKIHYFEELLHPSNLVLEPIKMVLILGGTFDMGSPETEIDRFRSESPQHPVTIPSFFMSEYPILQPHWLEVAQMAQIKRKLDFSPAHFKGTDRPVENVSWFEAVEFCQRLSRESGRIL